MNEARSRRGHRNGESPSARPRDLAGRRRVLLGLIFAGLGAVAVRAVDLQVLNTEFLRHEGEARHLRVVQVPAHRGVISDRHGEILAISSPLDTIGANPSEMDISRKPLAPLARLLDVELDDFIDTLERRRGREFVYLKRQINPELAQQVMDLNLKGVARQREYRRYYPAAEVAAHVLGFTNIDDAGQEGLELAYDDWLRGVPGSMRVIRDGRARVVKHVENIAAPNPGRDLALSLDRRLQFLAYRELKAAVQRHKAKSGSAVLLDVTTGEVLAMVNRPAYNPNRRERSSGSRLRNRAVTDLFEPGSTMKPFTVACGLEEGLYSPHTRINTSPGLFRVGRHAVRDLRDYGRIDVATVLKKSSNVGSSKIALALPAERLWSLFAGLGFGSPTESLFPGEAAGRLRHFDDWVKIDQATLAFGYGLSTTSLQLARAYAVLAADGLRRPVSMLRVDEAPAGQRVMSENTARSVRGMLEAVVSAEGTAPQAAIAGYRVAGKTGTVRKSKAGGYSNKRYQAVFAGMAPASRPRLVMVVMIDEPSAGDYYGGLVAAPVFSKVMSGALRLMNIPPDAPESEPVLLARAGATP